MKIPLNRYYEILVKYLRQQKLRFWVLVSLMLTSIGLQVVNPQIIRYFIDTAKSGGSLRLLAYAAVAYISIALLQQIIAVSATYNGEYVAWVATNALRVDLATHCLNLDMDFHNNRSPGELIERIEGDALDFSNFFSQFVSLVIGNILLLIGIIISLLAVNWRLGMMYAIFVLITLTVLALVRNVAVPYQKAWRDSATEFFGFLEERLAGTEDIRSCGAVDFVLRRLYQLMTVILHCWTKAVRVQLVVRLAAGMLITGGFAISFVSGYHLYREGVISLGIAYLIINYTQLLIRPIRELTTQVESLQNIGATIERMSELLNQSSAIADGPGAEVPAHGPLSLAFKHVSFAYAEEKPVLQDFSFTLEPGKILGLLGRTGSGKTTLARLIFRLYESQQGEILLHGTEIRQFTLHQLRHRVAYVTQDVQLFQASVRDNITFFDQTIPDERILEVIDALELGDWFRALPEGLDTRLETGGRSLSAGEAQLLAFTRVFLRDPGLVILDEASSRLDPATERLVERAIDHLLQQRTALIIAHRLGTLHRADDILILEDGQALEYGDRLSLLNDPSSRFAELHRTGLEGLLA
ncbi:MAG: ABC transporter ATP-binding protein [Armatimonadota bacterium]